jgi:hypothetical protein
MATRTPTYGPHLRVQVSGVLGPAGSAWEIFSWGFAIGGGSGGLQVAENALSDVCDDVISYWQDPAALVSVFARITSIKIADVQPDGKWRNGVATYERTSPGIPGGSQGAGGTLTHAPQVALAVTLRTAINSPRTRGRFFLPLPTATVPGGSGLMDSGQATGVAERTATLFTQVNNQPGFDNNGNVVVVASTFGAITPVTSVSVGRVLDTITSRRNALKESYVDKPVLG